MRPLATGEVGDGDQGFPRVGRPVFHGQGGRGVADLGEGAPARGRSALLTHLWPGTDLAAAREAAGAGYRGTIGVATAGLVVKL